MKRTAVLIDGGFLFPQLRKRLAREVTASDIYEFATKTLEDRAEELFRIYYYDCPPYEGETVNPINRTPTNHATQPFAIGRRELLRELMVKDHVAFRRGVLSFDGWQIRGHVVKGLIKATSGTTAPTHLVDTDVFPKFTQKRVDMNIGLDVAWLSSKRIVDRIILVTADSDFIPAMKFARREGVQIVLVPLEGRPKLELKEHADIIRSVTFP